MRFSWCEAVQGLIPDPDGEFCDYSDYDQLRADNKALLDAAKAARLHLADYSRRSMFGTYCDDDVRKAQDILRAAIEHSEPQ